MINRSPARWGTTVFAAIAFTSMSSSAALAERPMPIPRNAVAASRAASPEARAHVRELYAGTPLRFERTVSRGGGHEEFIARGAGYAMALSPARVDVVLRNDPEQQAATFGMRLIDGSPRATAITRRLLPGVTNYVVGRDAHQWRTGVQGYSGVEYRDVYPGVNVVYYGNQQQLEYDFVIAPGANYKRIALAFDGVSAVRIDAAGNLVVATPAGDLMQRAPVIYQETATGRREIAGGYVRRDARRFGFWVGAHDPRLPLVIDPVLTYASYLGGSKDERAGGVAVDAEGNIYITGMTGAADFPIAAPAGLLHGRDNWDAFVVKLNPGGDQMIYATYIGGSSFDEPADLAVDASGNAYVIGSTGSSDFPTVHGIQSSLNGYDDAFIVKLNAAGAVAYSTYLGGSQDESGTGLAVDASGRAYVTGATFSANFPTVNAVQPTLAGSPALRTGDGGATWTAISNGLRVTSVTAFGIDPRDASTVYAGTRADGVYKSTDGGASWAAGGDLPSPVTALVVDAAGAVYAGTPWGVFVSRDGSATWTYSPLWADVSSLVIDPSTSTVYAGGKASYYQQGVFATTDGGETWTDTGLPAGVNSVTVSQSALYAGTDSGLYRSAAGAAWEMLPGIYETVTAIAANPFDANEVWAGTYSGLVHSATGGADWVPVWDAGQGIMSIALAPSSPTTVYVASWSGVVATDDGGWTWRWLSPGVQVDTLAVDPSVPATAYAGTSLQGDVFVARISADGATLDYSTYLGGGDAEWDSDIALDATGAAYIAGTTKSTDFPVLGAYQATAGGLMDVFVAKLSESGAPQYATYLGGYGSDYSARIAVDGAGRAHVAGVTLSRNFPVVNAFQPSIGGGYSDAFVTTLNAAGNGLAFSTFLGGNDQEVDSTQSLGPAVAVGPAGETVVTGTTRSTNFPLRHAVQSTFGGGITDAFVASFDAGGELQYSTYLGGGADDYGRKVAVDSTGAAIVVGATSSGDFPTRDPLQAAKADGADVFVARLIEDQVPPTIAIGSPEAADYLHTDTLQLSFSAADTGAGLASGSPSATLDGAAVSNGDTIQLLTLMLGPHTFRVTASDNAGNATTQDVVFRVTASIDSLIAAVNLFTAQGEIAPNVSRPLIAKLQDAKQALAAGDVSGARSELAGFKAQVSARTGNGITPACAQVLVTDADYVLATL